MVGVTREGSTEVADDGTIVYPSLFWSTLIDYLLLQPPYPFVVILTLPLLSRGAEV